MGLDPVALVASYHKALNRYDAEEVRRFFAPDARYVSPGVNGAISGRDAIIAAFSAYFAEHPDQHAVDESIVVLSPRAARSVWRLAATSASTGEPYERRGTETVTFDEEGLIVSVVVEDL